MAQGSIPVRRSGSVVSLTLLGGIAAALVTVVLLVGLIGLIVQGQGLGLRNWLVVLFQMNSGLGSLPTDPLHIINPMDIAVLALVGLALLGLWPVLGHRHPIWTGIAIAQPFVGILLLVVTSQNGRSAVMGAGLVIAVLVLIGGRGQILGIAGLIANALLLAGDLGTGVLPGSLLAAALAGGYVLLGVWFGLLAFSLFAGVAAGGGWSLRSASGG